MKLERYTGALVGVHVGDSIGAPYETWSAHDIASDIARRGELTFFDYLNPWAKDGNEEILPAGQPTDDSDQTAVLADSLSRCGSVDVEDLYGALRTLLRERTSLLWKGRTTDAGRTTRDALRPETYAASIQEVPPNTLGTNGSLMRCMPMALFFGSLEHYDPESVARMSRVTHRNKAAIQACQYYTVLALMLLHEYDIEEAVEQASSYIVCEDIRRLVDVASQKPPKDPGKWPERGLAMHSLHVALYSLLESKDFAKGIELAVRIGGDTDTNAAIAGGLLGAYYGYKSIPKCWREAILGHDMMCTLAHDLFEIAQT